MHHLARPPVAALAAVLWCALAAAVSALQCPEPVVQSSSPVVVVGLTSWLNNTSGDSSRAGLLAALADATEISRLRFEPAVLDAADWRASAASARELACGTNNRSGSAFLIAGTVGQDLSEAILGMGIAGPGGTRMPLVGALTSSPVLHNASLVRGADGRVGVVNVRAEAVDEMSAILNFLSRDYDTLRSTAIMTLTTAYGIMAEGIITSALDALKMQPWGVSRFEQHLPVTEASNIVQRLLDNSSRSVSQVPAAVLVVSTDEMTAPIIAEMVRREFRGVTYVCGANPGAKDVFSGLGSATLKKLSDLNSQIYFQQHVPQPSSTSTLITEFKASMKNAKNTLTLDADMLEGYIVGRLIAMAASRSLEIYGWPLTRQTFLDTVYRSYRTFDLRGTEFGPYGDGAAPQTEEDWCSHGLHEVFMDRMDLGTGALVEERSSSFKFAGCNVPKFSSNKSVLVGFSLAETGEQSVLDGMIRLGLSAALSAANSKRNTNDHLVLVANFRGDSAADNVRRMLKSSAVAVVALDSEAVYQAREVIKQEGKSIAMVAPLSGSYGLRWPFEQASRVINVVPLAQQQLFVALQYIRNGTTDSRRVGLVCETTPVGTDYLDAIDAAINKLDNSRKLSYVPAQFTNYTTTMATAIATLNGPVDAYIFVGKPRAAAQFLIELYKDSSTHSKPKMLCPDVLQDLLSTAIEEAKVSTDVLTGVRLLSNTPPLAMLPKTNAARQQYELWVSEIDRGESSFRGFFVGLFLNAVIDAIDNTVVEQGKSTDITSDTIINTVYSKKVFDVGRITVGGFTNVCPSGTYTHCINQGLGNVYIIAWQQSGKVFAYEPFTAKDITSGGEMFDLTPLDGNKKKDDMLGLTLGLALGLGVAAALIVMLSLIMYFHSKRTLSFLNIKRPDLEINECIGRGHQGPLHVGDWHGTTVAIRVINKKEVTKGDLATIKEEIGLLHKLHHPNLLMLMGYCETQNELYVVSEYMSGGSLKEYLARNRGQLGVFSLIAMAFDVVKGIAYLHASKPPIVHGSISTRSLLVDDKLTTKVSDFWFSHAAGRKSGSTSHNKTPKQEWMAPEVCTGLVTQATDVWAFGIVLWELFQSNSKQEAPAPALAAASGPVSASKSSSSSVPMSTQVSLHPEPDASTPKEVVELLYRCWEPQPDQRPTIFQVLRLWPSTFASIGRFELPSDLSQVQITDDSRTSGTAPGPDAVVPVAMMSHSEQDTVQSLHFEFGSPTDPVSLASMQSGLVVDPVAVAPGTVMQAMSPRQVMSPRDSATIV
eukprot:m51a1_g2835 putative flag-tagged protein kinase domain of mitogen-activated protein kinase kinase kinase (1274) ;mRNA; f:247238-251146